jgi:hypothetical protein
MLQKRPSELDLTCIDHVDLLLHAPVALFSADIERDATRSRDRFAPADAARRHDPPGGAGIYSWLPLGKRVLDKICTIVREEQNRSGAHRAADADAPTGRSVDRIGRYDAYGRRCCASPTAMIAHALRADQ